MSQYSLSVLCHFVALADCIRYGYVGGQFVITRNILSFFFLHHNNNSRGSLQAVKKNSFAIGTFA